MGMKKPKIHILKQGFTIIELVIVISIIAILATITIVGYNGWRNTALAAQIKNDLNGEATAMESYRQFNNQYPTSLSSLTTFTASANDVLTLSSDSTTTNYCIEGYNTANPTNVFYIASETKDQGALSGPCSSRPGAPGAPATPTGLAATPISSSEIDLSWTPVSGTGVTYTIQRATDPAFVYVVGEITQSGTTRASTGLSPYTAYFYRVEANVSGVSSAWSSTASATTMTAGPSGLAATAASTTQINYSWSALAGAASYNIQIDTDSAFTTPAPTTRSQTTLSGSFTSLNPSTTYYLRVQAVNGNGTTSSYSSSVNATTLTNWSVYSKFAGVGDWNLDGKNDIVGYKPDGTVDLHLGNGNATFGPAIALTNIGTIVRDIIGPGTLPSGSAPIIWWDNTDGTGYALKSNGSTGITGSPLTSSVAGGWNACTTVFAAPLYYTGSTIVICESSALTEYSLSSTATTALLITWGSSWSASYGTSVFGAGKYVGGDSIGDIVGINSAGSCISYAGIGAGTAGAGTNTCSSGWTNNFVTGGWDFNGDGNADILRYYIPSSLFCFYGGNNAGGIASGAGCSILIN